MSDLPAKRMRVEMGEKVISDSSVKFGIGDGVFVVVGFFNYVVKVHIRKYANEDIPTACGVTMSPATWLDFVSDISNKHLNRASTVYNRELLLLQCEEPDFGFHLQKMFTKSSGSLQLQPNFIRLTCAQIDEMCSIAKTVTQTVYTYQLEKALPHQILMQMPGLVSSVTSDENFSVELTVILTEVLTEHFSKTMDKVFPCDACVIDDPSQLHHDCMNFSNQYKFDAYFANALCALDIWNVAKDFCLKTINFPITADFLNFDQQKMLESIEKMYVLPDEGKWFD